MHVNIPLISRNPSFCIIIPARKKKSRTTCTFKLQNANASIPNKKHKNSFGNPIFICLRVYICIKINELIFYNPSRWPKLKVTHLNYIGNPRINLKSRASISHNTTKRAIKHFCTPSFSPRGYIFVPSAELHITHQRAMHPMPTIKIFTSSESRRFRFSRNPHAAPLLQKHRRTA